MRENYSYKKPKNVLEAAGTGIKLGVDQGIEKAQLRSVIAERMKSVRVDAKKTQEEFAISIGSNYLTYRGYENRRSDVPIVLLLRIAELYQVSMDYLTGRTDFRQASSATMETRLQQLEEAVAKLENK
jgi:transcriptional regulator with XRE-family HTH domain